MSQPPSEEWIEPEILIEEERTSGSSNGGMPRYSFASRVGLRFLACIALLLFSLWAGVALFGTLIALLVYLVTFCRVKEYQPTLKRYWRISRIGLAGMVASIVALFSPRFGLGIMLIYFVLIQAEESIDTPFLNQMRGQFRQAYQRF